MFERIAINKVSLIIMRWGLLSFCYQFWDHLKMFERIAINKVSLIIMRWGLLSFYFICYCSSMSNDWTLCNTYQDLMYDELRNHKTLTLYMWQNPDPVYFIEPWPWLIYKTVTLYKSQKLKQGQGSMTCTASIIWRKLPSAIQVFK